MAEMVLFVASESGVVTSVRQGERWITRQRSLEGLGVTSLAASPKQIVAGTRVGIYRSTDAGKTWQEASAGLATGHVRWLANHPVSLSMVFAGTEPAGIFVSTDSGSSWRACREVEAMRVSFGWSLPYSPEAGCVRGLAFHGLRGYAAVEDGCVLVSSDGGESWGLAGGSRGFPDHAPRSGFIHSDVHSIAVHPSSPDRVAAPTGGGFYLSEDGGRTWSNRYRSSYARAVWLDPDDVEHMILGPADGVDRNGRIEETHDGGFTWRDASGGMEVPWRNHMVERFLHAGGQLLAVLSNGELYITGLSEIVWEQMLLDVKDINAVAFISTEEKTDG